MPHSQQRYLFIDLLRFLAVVFMIQGHTFDALLDFSLRTHSLYFIHDFFHGFIAPMFLFASGVAFGISTFKKWEEHTAFSKTVARRYGKFVGLILIGYALHLPFFSLQKIVSEAKPNEIAAWLQVDALQCIAVTLLILQTAVLILKQERRFVIFLSFLAAGVIFLSPLVWNIDAVGAMPLWIASYINAGNNSWFPLFPWSGYILSGVVFAWIFMNAQDRGTAAELMEKNVVAGLAALVVSFIVVNLPTNVYPLHDVWKVNPLIITGRLGFVLLVTSGIFFAERSLKINPFLPRIIGRESLFIYILHLVILYGSVVNKGLQQIILPTLSVVESSAAFVIVFVSIGGFTVGWHQVKKHHAQTAMAARIALAIIFIFFFLIRPY